MTQVKKASFLSYKYSPLNLSEISTYRDKFCNVYKIQDTIEDKKP